MTARLDCGASDDAECRVGDVGIRSGEVDPVEGIEEIRAELEVVVFNDFRCLRQGQIDALLPGVAERGVGGKVAKLGYAWAPESGRRTGNGRANRCVGAISYARGAEVIIQAALGGAVSLNLLETEAGL